MGSRSKRSRQWLSANWKFVLPGGPPVRLTVEASRPEFHAFHSDAPSRATAWAITAALWIAGEPKVRLRRRGPEVVIRLDRVGAQLNGVLESHGVLESRAHLDQAERLDRWEKAVRLGSSSDPEAQRRVLQFFAAEAPGAKWPPIRIIVNHQDLGRLRVGIEAHPFQFALQAFFVVGTLHAKAATQPRGRQIRGSTRSKLIALLACVADEFIRQGGSAVEAARVAAAKAGYGSRPGQLQLTYFLVEQALSRQWGISLSERQTDYRDFAKTYLYPHRAALSAWAAKVAASPQLMQMFGFDALA